MYPLLMTEEAMVIHMFDYNVHGFVRSQGVRSEPVTIRYHLTPTSNDFVQLQHLVPIHQFGMLLRHYILADLAFIPLTEPYLQEYVKDFYNTSPRRLSKRLPSDFPTKTSQQFFIFAQMEIEGWHGEFLGQKLICE
ncbi:protease Do-like 10, mitochondrial isoform X1 [Physcomitrium patens]|uniref:protease Do-like 10, mitochondrial isoform X1 n=1 Tax=Physcomitrium patens TaxID=3218 RepID=UPI003CCCC155